MTPYEDPQTAAALMAEALEVEVEPRTFAQVCSPAFYASDGDVLHRGVRVEFPGALLDLMDRDPASKAVADELSAAMAAAKRQRGRK